MTIAPLLRTKGRTNHAAVAQKDAQCALAIHRTLQTTVAQPKSTSAKTASLAQCALRALQRQSEACKGKWAPLPKLQRPARHAAQTPWPVARSAGPSVSITAQLEHAVAAYVATLTEVAPQRSCALATQYVLPAADALRAMTPECPDALLALIDLQNMLLQASWQPAASVPCTSTLARWAHWLSPNQTPHAPLLAARRMLSRALVTNLKRLWQGMLATPQGGGVEANQVLSALVRWPPMSELCDYDILRRSLVCEDHSILDVKALQAQLLAAEQSAALSKRAALQLRLLAWRLAVFEPATGADALHKPPWGQKRFAQLQNEFAAASARIVVSEQDEEARRAALEADGTFEAVPNTATGASQTDAQALRQAQALVEIHAATLAYRRGLPDAAEP